MARVVVLLLSLLACAWSATATHADTAADAAAAEPNVLVRTPLSSWRFGSLNGSIALASVSTPGTSHTHLLDAGVLTEDPYMRFNELAMQWVAQTTWVYETLLPVAMGNNSARVVFTCLDGVAHVSLNGEPLAASPAVNAFHPHVFHLPKQWLRADGNNTLRVVFTPPLEYTKHAASAYPYDVPATRNFNVWAEPSRRPFLRKAGSDFGWDWGPAFVTSGIAGDAYVEWLSPSIGEDEEEATKATGSITLSSLNVVYSFPSRGNFSFVRGHVSVDMESVRSLKGHNVTLQLFVDGRPHGSSDANNMVSIRPVSLSEPDEDTMTTTTTNVRLPFLLHNPILWWPASHGAPHLYDLRVDAFFSEQQQQQKPAATLSHRVGFRSVELIQEPTTNNGTTFYFRINNLPIFMKGANWIPNDAFSTRVSPHKTTFLLQSALDANMNMLRVWGGGKYESEAFYATCDALGLLVWQEFMFACAMYPRDASFLQQVEKEIIFQTKRLRKFTSLVIWGGNNENENMMASFGDGQFVQEPFNRDVFVVDYSVLFVDLIRPLVASLDEKGARPFLDTSPSNGLLSSSDSLYVKRWGTNTNDLLFGDIHYYNYTGDCQDPLLYPQGARFVSEFGFQSMPSFQSLDEISSPQDWESFHSFWKLLKFRERHANGTQQMAQQLSRRFHLPFPFLDEQWLEMPLDGGSSTTTIDVRARVASYLYLTQIQQALCYQTAIETWRKSQNPKLGGGGTMGILYWQLNDVWQGTSWSSIEYNGRWKSLQYAVKRAFAPVLVTVYEQKEELVVYGVNDLKDRDLEVELVYDLVETLTGHVVHTVTPTEPKTLPRLSSELLDRVPVAWLLNKATGCETPTQCLLRVKWTTSLGSLGPSLFGDAVYLFAPYKHLELRHGRVHIDQVVVASATTSADEYDRVVAFDVTLRCENFVALFVEVDVGPRVRGSWDANSFHLIGNETRTLRFTVTEAEETKAGLRPSPLTVESFRESLELRWLQQTYEFGTLAGVE